MRCVYEPTVGWTVYIGQTPPRTPRYSAYNHVVCSLDDARASGIEPAQLVEALELARQRHDATSAALTAHHQERERREQAARAARVQEVEKLEQEQREQRRNWEEADGRLRSDLTAGGLEPAIIDVICSAPFMVTTEEAAALLGVAESTVRKWTKPDERLTYSSGSYSRRRDWIEHRYLRATLGRLLLQQPRRSAKALNAISRHVLET